MYKKGKLFLNSGMLLTNIYSFIQQLFFIVEEYLAWDLPS